MVNLLCKWVVIQGKKLPYDGPSPTAAKTVLLAEENADAKQ